MTTTRKGVRSAPRRRSAATKPAREQAADTMRAFIRTLEKLGGRRAPAPASARPGEGGR